MLRMDRWEQAAPHAATSVATSPTHYFRHAGQSAASLARIIRECSADYRCTDHITVWTREVRGYGPDLVTEDAYEVLGWTSAAILRTSLSRRLDALNPVAAFRLLDQPEMATSSCREPTMSSCAAATASAMSGRPSCPVRSPDSTSTCGSARNPPNWTARRARLRHLPEGGASRVPRSPAERCRGRPRAIRSAPAAAYSRHGTRPLLGHVLAGAAAALPPR